MKSNSGALPLSEIAKALHAGGLTVFEITLRTPQAWAAVEALRKELPDACVGIGTVMREGQLRQAHESGVDFAVSAALHLPLVEAAQKLGLPYLPGTETASEVFAAREAGCTTLKLFPAVASMGMDRLKNFAPVFSIWDQLFGTAHFPAPAPDHHPANKLLPD